MFNFLEKEPKGTIEKLYFDLRISLFCLPIVICVLFFLKEFLSFEISLILSVLFPAVIVAILKIYAQRGYAKNLGFSTKDFVIERVEFQEFGFPGQPIVVSSRFIEGHLNLNLRLQVKDYA